MVRVLKTKDEVSACGSPLCGALSPVCQGNGALVEYGALCLVPAATSIASSVATADETMQPQALSDSVERLQRVLHEMVGAFAHQRGELLLELKPVLLAMLFGAVERIVRAEVVTNRDIVIRCLEATLDDLRLNGRVRARINPVDVEPLRNALEREALCALPGCDIDIVADCSISAGGCLLETDYGQVDATIQTQLAALECALGLAP